MSLRQDAIAAMDTAYMAAAEEQGYDGLYNDRVLDGLLGADLGDELCACPLAVAFKAHKVKIHLLALRLALSVDKETPRYPQILNTAGIVITEDQ